MKNFQRQLEDVVKYLFATVFLSQQNCQALEEGLSASANAPQHLLGHSLCPVNLERSGGAQSSLCLSRYKFMALKWTTKLPKVLKETRVSVLNYRGSKKRIGRCVTLLVQYMKLDQPSQSRPRSIPWGLWNKNRVWLRKSSISTG